MVGSGFKVLLTKEFKEVKRSVLSSFLYSIFYAVFIEWFILQNYIKAYAKLANAGTLDIPELLGQAALSTLMFAGPIMITFFGNIIMTRSFIRERSSGALIPLLGTGIKQRAVWLAKLTTAFCISYIALIIALLINVLMIIFHFKIPIRVSFYALVSTLLITPVASLAVLSILSVLYWSLKSPQFIAATVPTLFSISIWTYLVAKPRTVVDISVLVIVISISAITIFMCAIIINRLNRKRLMAI